MNLLSKGQTNAKLAKNNRQTYILYLAPFTLSGVNVCPKASAGCAAACLFSSGRGAFSNVYNARMKKTQFFIHDQKAFYYQLKTELEKIDMNGAAVRLNGTSDIDHPTNFRKWTGLNLFETFPNIQFYDYTKRIELLKKYKGTNYNLTFSRSEINQPECFEALNMGYNVAAVFSGPLPSHYMGFHVVDGDTTDERFTDPAGVIVGLKAKGKAKKDNTGFVIN